MSAVAMLGWTTKLWRLYHALKGSIPGQISCCTSVVSLFLLPLPCLHCNKLQQAGLHQVYQWTLVPTTWAGMALPMLPQGPFWGVVMRHGRKEACLITIDGEGIVRSMGRLAYPFPSSSSSSSSADMNSFLVFQVCGFVVPS